MYNNCFICKLDGESTTILTLSNNYKSTRRGSINQFHYSFEQQRHRKDHFSNFVVPSLTTSLCPMTAFTEWKFYWEISRKWFKVNYEGLIQSCIIIALFANWMENQLLSSHYLTIINPPGGDLSINFIIPLSNKDIGKIIFKLCCS